MFFKRKIILPDIRDYKPETELILKKSECVKPEMPVIDAHVHLGPRYPGEDFLNRYDIDSFVQKMKNEGIQSAIDLEMYLPDFYYSVLKKAEKYMDFFHFCMPVEMDSFEDPAFNRKITGSFKQMMESAPVCGIKVWKNLGLELRRRNGALAHLDDAEFDVIWKFAAENNLPVVIHAADPTAFFKKPDCKNERLEELIQYPMWQYFRSKYPAHADILNQLDRVMRLNPSTVFVAAHICSLANDLDSVEMLMDEHPNLNVDISAVLAEIGRQPRRFYRFACKYQDRILFGTDTFAGTELCYEQYYRFLGTEDEYFEYKPDGDHSQGNWRIYGANLPCSVLRKIYYDNANRIFLKRN